MKLDQIFSESELYRIRELAPEPSVVGVGDQPTMAPQAGQAAVSVDPAAAQKAQQMAVKQMQDKKKQVQDQIKAKEQELIALRKQLAELG